MTDRKATSIRSELQLFESLLGEFLELISDPERANATGPSSGWSPLGHAEHIAKANVGALTQLEKTLQRSGGLPIRWWARLLLALRYIPRGRAKAPAGYGAEGWPLSKVAGALAEQQRLSRELGGRCEDLAQSTGRSKHPVFGGLDSAQWARFLSIHTNHHLSIAKDVLRRA